MATPARGSSIIATVGGQTPTVTSSSWAPIKRTFFTAKDVADPESLYKVLYKLQENFHALAKPLSQNAAIPANRHTGIVFTAGQTLYIQHRLGRAFQGYHCVRAQGGFPSFMEAAFPAGTDASSILPLTSQNAGTFDLLIF